MGKILRLNCSKNLTRELAHKAISFKKIENVSNHPKTRSLHYSHWSIKWFFFFEVRFYCNTFLYYQYYFEKDFEHSLRFFTSPAWWSYILILTLLVTHILISVFETCDHRVGSFRRFESFVDIVFKLRSRLMPKNAGNAGFLRFLPVIQGFMQI